MKKIEILILGIIILVASFVRFYNLNTNPPSLYWDEVSQGYNAYSILKTGYDEHHVFMPITDFAAFGDYKAPVLIYFDSLSIALFGLSSFAVRFPSAFLGVMTVLFTFFLARELFWKSKYKNFIGLSSAFLLAISPWHIQLSRVAYEGNTATFFFVLGAFLFLLSLRKNFWIFFLSTISFVISFYAFNAFRVFTPLMVVALILIYFKEIFATRKKIIIFIFSSLVGIVILLPFILYLRNPVSRLRFNEVNIFSDIAPIVQANAWKSEDHYSVISKAVYNSRFIYTLYYLKHYFDFLNPTFLFYSGDVNPRFSLQDNGELFWFELPILLLGFYLVVKEKNKSAITILVWFILAPVAAATAHETPHALRAESYLPIFQVIEGFGGVFLISQLKKIKWGKFLILFYIFWIITTFYIFWHDYFTHFPVTYSGVFQYGYKQAVIDAKKIDNNYDLVLFSDHYGRAYVYYLFYSKYNPSDYWKNKVETEDIFGFYTVKSIGKYVFFRDSDNILPLENKYKKILFVAPPKEMPAGVKIIKKIDFINGDTAFELGHN